MRGIETNHVCIDATLFQRFAAENFECDPARIEIIDGFARHDALISSIVNSLGDQLRNPERAGKLFIDSAAQMLIAQLLRKYCAFPFPVPKGQARMSARKLQLVRIRDYVDAGLAGSITLEDIAASIHMSAYHFARTFKPTTGETPQSYVTRLRVERAQKLLRASSWSMPAIARSVGFSSKSHFAAVFLRLTGISPRRFRSATCSDLNEEAM